MIDANLIQIFIAGSLVAAAGGLLGSFALLRRMALVGDALSHVALPGIALGIIFHFNPFLGSLAFLTFGTVAIWLIEHKTKLPVDTLVGVLFALALAIGVLITPETELLESLFGDITKIGAVDSVLASILSLVIIGAILVMARRITLTLVSPDLALSAGYQPHAIELIFLLVFALTVAVGIKFVGALLMGSLVIIPAATARNLARSMKGYLAWSVILGVISAVTGLAVTQIYRLPPGPIFIIISGMIFIASILFKR